MGFSDLKARGESGGGHPLHNLKSLNSCCTCTLLRDAMNQTKLQYSCIPAACASPKSSKPPHSSPRYSSYTWVPGNCCQGCFSFCTWPFTFSACSKALRIASVIHLHFKCSTRKIKTTSKVWTFTCFSRGTQGDGKLTNQRNLNKVSRTRKWEWQGHTSLKPLIML